MGNKEQCNSSPEQGIGLLLSSLGQQVNIWQIKMGCPDIFWLARDNGG
jgi:hypothetical protein